MNKLTQKGILKALDWAYDKALKDIPVLGSTYDLANNFMNPNKSIDSNVNSLIKWQCTKAGTSGFVTGMGGFITMPVAIPANIASVFYIQIRMIAAIAYMNGYNLKDDRVRTLVYVCMTGKMATDLLKDIGIQIGKKIATNAIKDISGAVISKLNQKVGFKLFTLFGKKGVIKLGKAVPLVGGLVGGAFDVVTTHAIGNIAKRTFTNSK